MKVTLLGTGCPQCHPKRFGPSNLLSAGDTHILVDCGSGVTQRLVSAGVSGRDIDAVLLTHLHTDHVIDLYQLIVSSWHQGRDRPQRIFGPKGTRTYVDGLMKLWRPEREMRIAHERRPSAIGLEVEVTEFDEGTFFETNDVSVRAVRVLHEPVKEAFGFVFQGKDGGKTVFSGDTAYCPALIKAASGADVLVHECFIHREMVPVEGVRSEETIAAVASYHTLPAEVGRVAREAGVKFLMANHFVPAEFDRKALAAEISAEFSGPFVIGEDLMCYNTKSRTLTHADGMLVLGR